MTVSTRSGIPTTYRGTNFRSRLEGRWAAFFDLVGWRWTYEPLDANGWIPDFLIHGAEPFLVEVGPCATEPEYRKKAAKALANPGRVVLVLGVSPLLTGLVAGFMPWTWAGLLVHELGAGTVWAAEWSRCDECRAVGVQDDRDVLPCGHGFSTTSIRDDELEALWAQAGNAVQWTR